MNYLSSFTAPSSIARTSSIIDSIDMETAIKRTTILGMTHYSMTVRDNNPLALTNFVLSERDGELTGYLITYDPEFEWIREQYIDPQWNTFNGVMTVQTLYGDTVLTKYMKDGKEEESSTSSGRTTGGIQCTEMVFLGYLYSKKNISSKTERLKKNTSLTSQNWCKRKVYTL